MDKARHGPAYTHKVRLATLRADDGRDVRLEPDAGARAAIAEELDLLGLRKVRLDGRLLPEGRGDWRFEADLGATVVQACVATLAPVTTRVEARVTRRYAAELPEPPPGEEIPMPDDDVEPLPAVLDLGAVLVEELALNLPLYPHADPSGAPVERSVAEPGVAPLTDEDTRPFAGLGALKDRMAKDDD